MLGPLPYNVAWSKGGIEAYSQALEQPVHRWADTVSDEKLEPVDGVLLYFVEHDCVRGGFPR